MSKRNIILVVSTCLLALAGGRTPGNCAGWPVPMVVAPPPQPPLQPLQQPPPLNTNLQTPALRDLPRAPEVVTANGQGGTSAGGGHEESTTGPAAAEESPDPSPVNKQAAPPVQEPAATVSNADHYSVTDSTPPQAHGKSDSKPPWLLIAGIVSVAFYLGRRSR